MLRYLGSKNVYLFVCFGLNHPRIPTGRFTESFVKIGPDWAEILMIPKIVSLFVFFCLFACLFACLFVCLVVCLSVCFLNHLGIHTARSPGRFVRIRKLN